MAPLNAKEGYVARTNLLSVGSIVLGLAAALPACSNSTAGMNVPIEMLGSSYATASCGVFASCFGATLLPLVAGVSSRAACEARGQAAYVNGALPRYRAALASGTLSYDGTQAQACVDAYSALGCGASTARRPGACAQLFTGHVGMGGACALNEECMGDAYCSTASGCPGTCQARSGSGTACTTDDACQSGLRCGGSGATRSCSAPAGDGAACQGQSDCGAGLLCIGASGTTAGACHPVATAFAAASGAACNPQAQQFCAVGLSCIITSPTSISCGAGGLANGTPCHVSVPDQCAAGSFCSGTNAMMGMFAGTCAPLPSAGMPCASVLVGARCADGSTCDGSTCAAVVDNGAACTTNADCAGGRCMGNVCVAPGYCP